MTTTLHAHLSTASSDCDGPMYRDYVEALNDAERVEHDEAQARGYNDFHELTFKARILAGQVSFHAECEVHVYPEGFRVSEPTDEGYRACEVRWCEDEGCDPNAYTQRDVFAEEMGY